MEEDKLREAAARLLGRVIDQIVVFNDAYKIYPFEIPMLNQAYAAGQVVVKVFRKVSWRQAFATFVPTTDPHNWHEVCVKDLAGDGSFRVETLRYSEEHKLFKFLCSGQFTEVPAGASEEKYFILGTAEQLATLAEHV